MIDRLNAALEGRYRIERELGAGGMATVYLAEDLKHQRKVALKVLKPELAAVVGAERFLAEIRTTAQLQHPHILPLHDSGEADSFLFYVMPYVEGESLRDRLDRAMQLPVEEAGALAVKVAGALQAAHDQGVVHRDIKPANILLGKRGEPLVADFGIALAVSQAGGGRITETGLSLGTPHYMSPEQATADQDVDARSDVYSLACVLYEMLAGDPPHTGSSAQAVIMRILTETPQDVTDVRKAVPPNVRDAIARALEKLPADRFESADAFGAALGSPAFRSRAAAATVGGAESAGPWRRLAIAMAAVSVVLAAVALSGWLRSTPKPVSRYSILLPEAGELRPPARFGPPRLALSRSLLVYSGQDGRLWARRRGELRAAPIVGTEGAWHPVLSPDGERVAFIQDGSLRVAAVSGGAPRTIADSLATLGLGWSDEGYLYWHAPATGGLMRVRESGGTPETVTTPDAEAVHLWPHPLPDGAGALFVVMQGGQIQDLTVEAWDARTGSRHVLLKGARAVYAPSGHIVYTSVEGDLLAVPFDLRELEVTGAAVTVAQGLSVRLNGANDVALAPDGTLMYATGGLRQGRLVRRARDGRIDVLPLDAGVFRGVRFSPEGRRIVFGRDFRVFVHDLTLGTTVPIDPERQAFDPLWSPDGRRILYHARTDSNLGWDGFEAAADGSGAPRQVFRLAEVSAGQSWAPDGRLLARGPGRGRGSDLFIVSFDGDSARAEPYLQADWDEFMAQLSSDGRFVAYVSDEREVNEVFVRPFSDPAAGRWQVSAAGGSEPIWGHDGHTLYYRRGSDLQVVQYRASPDFEVDGQTTLIVDEEYEQAYCCYANYDAHPDGDGFVMVHRSESPTRDELIVVENFLEELKARVPR